ncbi:MAG: hypothetical protein MI743_18350, partial [Sneathiellales bacterium]|nr:hypothetical protein [Sneathiellales bacterium]
GSILEVNTNYDGSVAERPVPSLTWEAPTAVGTIVSYKIVGPLPSTATVWEAVEPGTTDNTIEITTAGVTNWTPQEAIGSGVVNTNGFKGTKGGEYRAVITVGGAGCPGDVIRPFTVSWDHDVAASKVVSPKTNVYPRYFKYKEGTFISLLGEVQNVGLNDVEKFTVTAKIRNDKDELLDEIEYEYDSSNPEHAILKPGDKYEVDFGNWRSFDVGVYSMELVVDYLKDLEAYNDVVPRPDADKYTFEIAYDIQLQSTDILTPFNGETIKAGRPYNPVGLFTNVGISDVSDIDAKMTVRDAVTDELVYESLIVVPDVAQGRYNTQKATFAEMRILNEGTYKACIEINHGDDLVLTDNVYCHEFIVEAGMIGEFTLGTLNETDPGFTVDRNFETFDELLNALYYDGVTGDLVIKLT